MQKITKKLSKILLVAMSVLMLQVGVFATDSEANIMRLESFEGTITVTNSSGRVIKASENMRLLNGYTIETSEKSYAYISLDEDKAVKLDAVTECKIQEKGEQLEILLAKGELFFNVTAPLKPTETMNIRTSTMVTGIRGTSGFVSLIEEEIEGEATSKSVVSLLSGKVEVTHIALSTQQVEVGTITPGQTAIISTTANSTSEIFTILETVESEIPGFVAVEIAKDPELSETILEQSKLDVSEIAQNSTETLLKDEKEVEEKIQEEQKIAQEEQVEDSTENLFEDKEESTSSSSGGSSNDNDDDDSGSVTPPVEPEEQVVLEKPTAEQVKTALLEGHKTIVIKGALTGSDAFDVGEGQKLIFALESSSYTRAVNVAILSSLNITKNAEVIIEAGYNVQVTGEIVNNGKFENSGTLNSQRFTNGSNAQAIFKADSQYFVNNGSQNHTIINNGHIEVGTNAQISQIADLHNNGTIVNDGSIIASGNLYNTGEFTNSYMITFNQTGNNEGTMYLYGSKATFAGTFTNDGTIILEQLLTAVGSFANTSDSSTVIIKLDGIINVFENQVAKEVDKSNGIFIYHTAQNDASFADLNFVISGGEFDGYIGYSADAKRLIENAYENSTINLTGDIELQGALINKNLELNLSDKIITLSGTINVVDVEEFSILSDNSNNGILSKSGFAENMIYINDSTLNITGVNLTSSEGANVINALDSTINFNGSEIKAYKVNGADTGVAIELSNSILNLNDGMLSGVSNNIPINSVGHLVKLYDNSIFNLTATGSKTLEFIKGSAAIEFADDTNNVVKVESSSVGYNMRGTGTEIYLAYGDLAERNTSFEVGNYKLEISYDLNSNPIYEIIKE